MHKKLLNEAVFHLAISAEGPLLVKSGTETWDPTVPDMQFIRTRHARLGETVFIPGSSIKGTIRSYSEKIANTLNVRCCDLFHEKFSCGKLLDREAKDSNSRAIYQRSCVACKLYGSTVMAGRAAFADAYPTADVSAHLTKRTAVAIDRVLGSVAAGPFDFEALMSGEFETVIRLRNFELWQLGLLSLTVRDLCLGRVRIGYGKSRGFGSVSARLKKLEMRSIAPDGLTIGDGTLDVKGIGTLLSEDERTKYGIEGEAEARSISVNGGFKKTDDMIGTSVVFETPADPPAWCVSGTEALFSDCVKHSWNEYVKTHQAKGGQDG